MDAIVTAVAEKTGLDPSMIEKVVPAVVDFLAERLPGGIGDMLKGVAAGGEAGGLPDLKGGLGGLLGG